MEQREKKLFNDYLEIVAPAMMEYENRANAFPTGILNEVRNVFFHLAKKSLLEDEVKKQEELSKAEVHMKRAVRDSYKYLCVSLENSYQYYIKKFKIPLPKIKNERLRKIVLNIEHKHEVSLKNLYEARKMETHIDSNEKDDEIYKKYGVALESYRELLNQINEFYSFSE